MRFGSRATRERIRDRREQLSGPAGAVGTIGWGAAWLLGRARRSGRSVDGHRGVAHER